MKHAQKLLLVTLVSAGCLGSSFAQDTTSTDPVFRAFLAALGEPALIGANADHPLADTAYRPIPALRVEDLDANKMRLGFDLFHETRLSIDQTVGCNSCHSGMFGGTDGRAVSTGARSQLGNFNAPTTFNAAFNFRQFWDGRAVTLADQALGPIENELEMAHTLPAVIDMLEQDASYPAEFAAVYPDGITVNNMADAIAYFQRVNFTRPTTPFVRHLAGEEGQLSEQALRGWERFEEVGCVTCHNGINLGGNSYQQLGSALNYFVDGRIAGPRDDGVFARSGRRSDKNVFKVPTLHGVAETAPYFHDGSVDTLESAIQKMGEHQLGRVLSQQDIDDIAAFLNSTGGRPMGMAMGSMGMGRGMGMRGGMSSGGMSGGGMSAGGMPGGGNESAPTEQAATASSTASAAPSTAANNNSHKQLYQAAIAATAGASDKILSEMQRINSAEVANFDFLQFEHLELIRNARALAFPPAELDSSTQQVLQSSAEALLAASHELEWIIADFLRAEAMSRIMDTHINSSESTVRAGELGDPMQRKAGYQEQSAAMLTAMQASTVSARALVVHEAFASAQ
jgi:cytochrome c peroxidase